MFAAAPCGPTSQPPPARRQSAPAKPRLVLLRDVPIACSRRISVTAVKQPLGSAMCVDCLRTCFAGRCVSRLALLAHEPSRIDIRAPRNRPRKISSFAADGRRAPSATGCGWCTMLELESSTRALLRAQRCAPAGRIIAGCLAIRTNRTRWQRSPPFKRTPEGVPAEEDSPDPVLASDAVTCEAGTRDSPSHSGLVASPRMLAARSWRGRRMPDRRWRTWLLTRVKPCWVIGDDGSKGGHS
jgi:hypothetical protein